MFLCKVSGVHTGVTEDSGILGCTVVSLG